MALIDGLAGYWTLDEASGTRVDAHGALDLTATGTLPNRAGIIGTAVDFSGAAGQLGRTNADVALSSTDSYSFSFWARMVTGFNANWCSFLMNDGWSKLSLSTDPDSKIQNYGTSLIATSFVCPVDTWVHVVYTFESTGVDRGTDKLYINGAEAASLTDRSVPPASGTTLHVGHESSTYHVVGAMDEVGFWRRVLTPTEASDLTGGGAGLAYPFTVGGGSAFASPRLSAAHMLSWPVLAPPVPDGTIAAEDRIHAAQYYSGIAVAPPGGPVATKPFYYSIWRRRVAT